VSIQLTERAARRIQSQIANRGKGLGLRLGVKKSGCSGFAYTMDYADAVAPGEQVFDQHGARVVIHADHLPMLDGLTLDFQKQGLNESFRFLNPNVTGECGCGESFSVAKN
jgi:iron-sulfur cluster assembly protein